MAHFLEIGRNAPRYFSKRDASAFGTTSPFKPGRMNGRFPPMPVEWALGCFVRFREVDRGAPVTDLGAKRKRLAESRRSALRLATRQTGR
jgi:hypothetical protein